MPRSRPALAALTVLLLTLMSWATALDAPMLPRVTGLPGEYVTLPFNLIGVGEYEYRVDVPAPWQPLSSVGRVKIDGSGFMSVTMRVPTSTPAGSQVEVSVSFTPANGGGVELVAKGIVTVASQVALQLLAPDGLTGTLGQPLEVQLLLVNNGNMPDEVSFSADAGMFDLRLEFVRVLMAPGERREVTAVIVPRGQVSSGYRHVLRVEVTSSNDPSVRARAFVTSIFVDPSTGVARDAGGDPRLNLSIRTGVAGGLRIDEAGTVPSLRWDVTPSLSGELSDFVDVTAGVGGYSGNLMDPFSEVPSRFDVGLSAEDWSASASIGPGNYALSGSFALGDWRVGGGARYQDQLGSPHFGVNAFAISQLEDLDLQAIAQTDVRADGRTDAFAVQYRRPLTEGLVLAAGTQLVGATGTSGYTVSLGVNESLSWQSQDFYVTQTYSGVPFAQLHNIGVSAGTRSNGLFSVRASTNLQLRLGDDRWRNSVTLASRPFPGFSVAVTLGLDTSARATTWNLGPTVSYRQRFGPVTGSATVSYHHTGVLSGDASITDRYGVRLGLSGGPVTISGGGSYFTSTTTDTRELSERYTADVGVGLNLGLNATVATSFEYESNPTQSERSLNFSVSWTHDWHRFLRTRLSYDREHDFTLTSSRRNERAALIANFDNLILQGLTLGAGYAVSSDTGLITGLSPLQHDFSVRVGYTFNISFDTPDRVVDVFGGRRGGEVRGVVFIDRDLDGVRGPNEEIVSGLEVLLGDSSAVTDADGAYRLRVPAGNHPWAFGEGLPGQFAAYIEPAFTVEDDTVAEFDIPFVPIVTLSVRLFDDFDHDGVQSATENGISYGGVLIEGPMRRAVRLDGQGQASVTGLLPGTYRVRPDPDRLPARYNATTAPVVLQLQEGQRGASTSVGAAAPIREVVTTFTASDLAIIAMADRSSASIGDEVTITALVTGSPERVVVRIGAEEVEMTDTGGRWVGRVVIAEGTALGKLTLAVAAFRGDASVNGTVDLFVR